MGDDSIDVIGKPRREELVQATTVHNLRIPSDEEHSAQDALVGLLDLVPVPYDAGNPSVELDEASVALRLEQLGRGASEEAECGGGRPASRPGVVDYQRSDSADIVDGA